MTTDDRQVDEIRAWFDERGHDLYVHEIEGHGWRAPYMPKGSRIGSADYGSGASALEAAEDAKARFTRDHAVEVTALASMPIDVAGGVSASMTLGADVQKVQIGTAVETDTAQAITTKRKTIGTAIETDTAGGVRVPDVGKKVETLTTYGWRVLFEEESDGKVTGYLLDFDSGELLKMALGDDHEDAWLTLGIDTKAPSAEVPQ